MELAFSLNGEPRLLEVEPDAFLVDVIRSFGLTGTKEGCGVGVCGACTVVVDDRPVSSCCYLALMASGASVWTVEGLTGRDPGLVEAFVDHEGMQCGICTPGQVVSAYTLRLENPGASEEEIRGYMSGNLCRCTGYVTITEAVAAYLANG